MPGLLLRAAVLALGVVACLAPLEARAMTLAAMDLGDMTRTSTLVVRARCVDRQVTRRASGRIETLARFEVLESAKGDSPELVTVRQLGGKVDGFDLVVPGAPQSQAGDEAVLFLEPGDADGMQVVGLARGYLPVVAMPGGSPVVRIAPALDRKLQGRVLHPVSELLGRVREIDREGR